MRPNDAERLPLKLEQNFKELEERIMQDVVRRIHQYKRVTSTADWQLNRVKALGESTEAIEKYIKDTLNKSYPEMFELYDKALEFEYARSKALYEQINATFIPYEENLQMQQLVKVLQAQTKGELTNITRSMGFTVSMGGNKKAFTPLSEYYQKYLDQAIYDITSGAFDYNTVLRRTIKDMTDSGIRTVPFASGRSIRVVSASRTAVMTGITQLTGRIADENARKLGIDTFEVAWHEGARNTGTGLMNHQSWQGKVYTREELVNICGLGHMLGLCGANCYHEYYPFFPGISERNWSDEWLSKKNAKENTPTKWMAREYTTYQATQKQRQMEAVMRAQRDAVKLLQRGRADKDIILNERIKYQLQLDEYTRFSKRMGLKMQRERIYLDGNGRVAPDSRSLKNKAAKEVANKGKSDILYEKEIMIHKSLGAKGFNYPVKLPNGKTAKLMEGSKITKIFKFAGPGCKKPVRVAEFLSEQYGGKPEDWYHVTGDGYVDVDGVSKLAELHWFEAKNIGRIKMKVKRWRNES